MSNVILNNTSGQVDFTLRESYLRLTGSFVGPSGNGGAGFTIQDGAKNTGIFVANSCIDFCKNTLNFKQDSNLNFIIPSTRCFSVSGNNSSFLFNQEGTIAFGSGIDSNYKGLQVYSTNPTLTLRNTNASCNQFIQFLDCDGNKNFYICQNSSDGICISGTKLKFSTLNRDNSFTVSGSSFGFNADPVSAFNFLFSGSEYHSGSLQVRNDITGSGLCINSTDQLQTGLDVRNNSIFRGRAVFSGNSFFTGKNTLSSDGFIQSPTGCFLVSSGTCSAFTDGSLDSLRVNSYSYLNNGGQFTGNSFYNISYINSTGIISSGITGSCLRVNCNALITGHFLSGDVTGNAYFRACRLELLGTGLGIGMSGNVRLSGNLDSIGYTGCFNTICSFSTSPNMFCGPICVTGSICAGSDTFPTFLSTQFITGTCISATNTITGVNSIFQNFCQINGSAISCFCSSGLNVGLNQTGVIKSINTSKAWGVINVCAGNTVFSSGYNIKSTQIYSQGTTLNTLLIYAHGICFCEPIRYPFMVNFDVYGSGNALITGHNANSQSAQQLGFSGAGGTALVVTNAGLTTSPFSVQFYAISGKCSSSNAFSPFVVNSTYSEIYFNLQNCKGPTTLYSDLTRANANGLIHFNILGY